ncbi:hypothetical protein SESBI_34008 [Sesbania bispinosa]|nr:hypothetical protein SESBI_34008 [Sesbania bispinosa]
MVGTNCNLLRDIRIRITSHEELWHVEDGYSKLTVVLKLFFKGFADVNHPSKLIKG